MYECRICGHPEKAKLRDETENCVYRSEQSRMQDTLYVDKECIKDPTLARRTDIKCEKCGHYESVTFTNPTKDRMNLIFVCTKCTFYWKKEPNPNEVDSDSEEDQ